MNCLSASIAKTPPQRKSNSTENQNRRDIQTMKQEFRKQGVKMKRLHSKAVDQNNVSLLIRRQRLERDPAENQRKSNQYSEDTYPEEQLVHPPAQCRTAPNEGLASPPRWRLPPSQ